VVGVLASVGCTDSVKMTGDEVNYVLTCLVHRVSSQEFDT